MATLNRPLTEDEVRQLLNSDFARTMLRGVFSEVLGCRAVGRERSRDIREHRLAQQRLDDDGCPNPSPRIAHVDFNSTTIRWDPRDF